MTFGEEQAMSIGVDTGKFKVRFLILSSLLTGAAVCFSGIIGFVDLTIPHIVRKLFGATHRYVLPMSMILGGAFMSLADMISRTILSPREIPVGAVTALVGAPFFGKQIVDFFPKILCTRIENGRVSQYPFLFAERLLTQFAGMVIDSMEHVMVNLGKILIR